VGGWAPARGGETLFRVAQAPSRLIAKRRDGSVQRGAAVRKTAPNPPSQPRRWPRWIPKNR